MPTPTPLPPLRAYITEITHIHTNAADRAGELSYRAPLQNLLQATAPTIRFIQEPKQLPNIGAPDFLAYQNHHGTDRLIGCIETKNINDQDLQGQKTNKNQFDRYKKGIPNCLFTDYLRFIRTHNGEQVDDVAIAELTPQGTIRPLTQNHPRFEALIHAAFTATEPTPITTADQLTTRLATQTRLLADTIAQTMHHSDTQAGKSLNNHMRVFQQNLMDDITPDKFADLYAQTIAYGLLVARLQTPPSIPFNRQLAGQYIPESISFLRRFFNHIAGHDIERELKWLVDGMADTLAASDAEAIMQKHGQQTGAQDPVFHFYESFLAKYAPHQRRQRGVWYTPAPVVNFIVRAVDDILKTQFKLPQGLANRDTTRIAPRTPDAPDAPTPVTTHKLQILDPAAGTGTFLAEIIQQIHTQIDPGAWSDYVENHLLPRLNGFEILMAPYAMAHLRLATLLKTLGYIPRQAPPPRNRIYLTNALEQRDVDQGMLMADWLTREAQEANELKKFAPVMCVIGNPPYLAASANKGDWITEKMTDYKLEPGGKNRLREKNPKNLNNDYVKFIRYGQHLIEKNGGGIVAFINPHGYLANPTFRGMRWRLLKTYDRIYAIDLHGNVRTEKSQTATSSQDANIFDIQLGVSINLFVKTGEKKAGELAQVFHHDLYGTRAHKSEFLQNHTLAAVPFQKLTPQAPMYFMAPRSDSDEAEYRRGFATHELFLQHTSGITTGKDGFSIHFTAGAVTAAIKKFLSLPPARAQEKFHLTPEQEQAVRRDLAAHHPQAGAPRLIMYRPFDYRWTYYTGQNDGFLSRTRHRVMRHFLAGDNVGLVTARGFAAATDAAPALVAQHLVSNGGFRNPGMLGRDCYAPLYLYSATDPLAPADATLPPTRTPNLNPTIVSEIAKKTGLAYTPTPEPTQNPNTFTPENLLDYLYATLHTPTYRTKFAEFLKTDFPRIPYPTNADHFQKLAAIGEKLRQTHLLNPETLAPITTELNIKYPTSGDGIVTKAEFIPSKEGAKEGAPALGKVYINKTQHFTHIPQTAWEHPIGGYRPAQKYLKDRKNHPLSYNDIEHYKTLIAALHHTATLTAKLNPRD